MGLGAAATRQMVQRGKMTHLQIMVQTHTAAAQTLSVQTLLLDVSAQIVFLLHLHIMVVQVPVQ